MPKRPDYGDATPEDPALALMRFQRAPLTKRPEIGAEEARSGTRSRGLKSRPRSTYP